SAARKSLGLPDGKTVIAVMPGSRKNELEKHVRIFLEAANWCCRYQEDLHFVTSLTNSGARSYFEYNAAMTSPHISLSVYTDRSLEVMEAADVVLLASGTAALEAMLLKRPMVVGHKVSWLTWQIAKRLVRLPYVSLPNILAGRKIVPECLQYECTPEILGREILRWLRHPDEVQKLAGEFTGLHRVIRTDSDAVLANAVLHAINAAA
ncbi:MAG: lipid-A-disaccharide synthase, partial [Gammaproteobacteria bacterium]